MRFPWQPHEYARTCTVRSISMISVASRTAIDRGELTRKVRSASAANLSADLPALPEVRRRPLHAARAAR
jgi:hypothetical protein